MTPRDPETFLACLLVGAVLCILAGMAYDLLKDWRPELEGDELPEQDEQAPKLVQGQRVMLNSGGPVMVVAGDEPDGRVLCVWHDGVVTRWAPFDARCLTLVPLLCEVETSTGQKRAEQAEEVAKLRADIDALTNVHFKLCQCIHNMVVAEQAAWIEWKHGRGADAAMQWIENGLIGPGHIPDVPDGADAQAYYNANYDERMKQGDERKGLTT